MVCLHPTSHFTECRELASGGQLNLHARAREILAYFVRHPQATDSLEGVARWRVQQEAIHHTVEHVSQALDWLVELGFLMRETRTGSVPLFRLNESKVADAARFLADARDASDTQQRRREPTVSTGAPEGMRPVMHRALAWVDAALLRHLRAHPVSGGDFPGLTRSHASVESLLVHHVDSRDRGRDASNAALLSAMESLEATLAHDDREPLLALYRHLGLSRLELQAVLLCLAPEVDVKYQSVYGVLNDDLGRRTPTLGLLCSLLGEPEAVRSTLERSNGLTRWRLLESGVTLPHADESVRLETSVVSWLLGNEWALLNDTACNQCVQQEISHGATWFDAESENSVLAVRLARFFASNGDRWLLLAGEDAGGNKAILEMTAKRSGRAIVRLVTPMPSVSDRASADEIAARLARAVRVLNAIPVIDASESQNDAASVAMTTRFTRLLAERCDKGILVVPEAKQVIAALPRERVEVLNRPRPDKALLASLFASAAAEAQLTLTDDEARQLAMAYPLPIPLIDEAARLAQSENFGESRHSHYAVLAAACRQVACPDLPRFAQRVVPTVALDDVILPDERQAQLREIVSHVQHSYQVLHRWGFDQQLSYGRGVAALFAGPSGTGKTMAAQALARELDTEAFVVDLSRVTSKYIGESEKNLDAVFTDAERAGAVLLFDEADALFGKRSEIKDAHDRYANIEVAYLLQRMEAFNGLAILSTNFRGNLDDAFLRRLRFVVEFPKPDADHRENIWRRCLPKAAPVADDVNVRLLARRLELTGGNIRQITVRAAFAAAADGKPAIGMRHVIQAARAELQKLGVSGVEREMAELEAAQQRAVTRVA
jgi:AAA+ superfamily predicted ATPase